MSTKPGATMRPVASRVWAAGFSEPSNPASSPFRLRTSTMRPSLTPMSARYRSAPVPSTTVPPVIFRSYIPASSDQAGRVEDPRRIGFGEVFHPGRRGIVGQRRHVPVVLPHSDFAVLNAVHGDELQSRGFARWPLPFLVVLIHYVGAVVDHQPGKFLVGRQRFESDLESFDDVFGSAGGRGRPHRHVEIDAVVGQERLELIPVACRQGLPHAENRILN